MTVQPVININNPVVKIPMVNKVQKPYKINKDKKHPTDSKLGTLIDVRI